MGYLERSVTYSKTELRAHKQGRFITTATGYLERPEGDQIDLHSFLTGHRNSINLWPVYTNVMRPSGLFKGCFALVDRAKEPALNKIVVVRFNNQVVMRRLMQKNGRWCLVADDPREEILYIRQHDQIERLGVVTYGIVEL